LHFIRVRRLPKFAADPTFVNGSDMDAEVFDGAV
jgi:hypothetical protein